MTGNFCQILFFIQWCDW